MIIMSIVCFIGAAILIFRGLRMRAYWLCVVGFGLSVVGGYLLP